MPSIYDLKPGFQALLRPLTAFMSGVDQNENNCWIKMRIRWFALCPLLNPTQPGFQSGKLLGCGAARPSKAGPKWQADPKSFCCNNLHLSF
jgi:hypothetical protein